MELKLTNSTSGNKELFKPIDSNKVTFYSCGPTVYSYAHIGNMRAAVSSDLVYRVLVYIYGKESVVYSRNITDIDDKIITKMQTPEDRSTASTCMVRLHN